jgi:hypothetical protein
MTCFVGLDVSQKMTAVCVVDNAGRRLWRGQCPTVPEQVRILVRRGENRVPGGSDQPLTKEPRLENAPGWQGFS